MTLHTTVEEKEENLNLKFSNWGFKLSGKKKRVKYTATDGALHLYSVLSRAEHCFDVPIPPLENLE